MNAFIAILTASLAILGSVIIWWLNEKSKRNNEIYQKKAEKYEKLIQSISGFFGNQVDKKTYG